MNTKIENLAAITRKDFPMFEETGIKHPKGIYLDHAATSQKPKSVINALNKYYEEYNANVHRGAHQLSREATESFEAARNITAKFINANSSSEIIFTRNATEAINLIARTWGDSQLTKDDEILLTIMEHHSNLVPWQLLSQRTGCKIRYATITSSGELDIEDFKSKVNPKTRLVSIVHISNTLGCCNPIKQIADISHKSGALLLLDACQSLAHKKIDINELNIDFLAGSSHKICGPTGIGFLWGREEILESMPPFLGGGEMIKDVSLDHSTWTELPHKFEAGTPAIAEAIGMGEAIKYLTSIGLDNIQEWEASLTKYLFDKLRGISEINILGPCPEVQSNRGSLATFSIHNIHANDIAELLDVNKIFIRSGHHCCQPLHKFYSLNASARASLSFTTTFEEIDIFIEELSSAIKLLQKYS